MSINNNTKKEKKQYKHLNSYERGQIALLHNDGKSIRYIAKKINRNPATVSREIKRNSTTLQNSMYEFIPTYIPETADLISKDRKKKVNLLLKYDNEFFEQLYLALTTKYRLHSVESFVHEWKTNFPEKRIPSFKTVYRFIRLDLLKLKLYKLPRMSKLRPRVKKNSKPRDNKKVLGTSIDLRPDIINDRKEIGHMEIDTVKGKNGKNEAVALTLVDRVSRFSYIMYLDKLNAENVNKELKKLFRRVGKKTIKSITSDNGSEFSLLSSLESKNLKVYFAHPYAPHERGTNENTNGLLREFLPKGKSMNGLKNEFKKIEECLNNRNRKILNFRKPIDLHNEYLKKVTLAKN